MKKAINSMDQIILISAREVFFYGIDVAHGNTCEMGNKTLIMRKIVITWLDFLFLNSFLNDISSFYLNHPALKTHTSHASFKYLIIAIKAKKYIDISLVKK